MEYIFYFNKIRKESKCYVSSYRDKIYIEIGKYIQIIKFKRVFKVV